MSPASYLTAPPRDAKPILSPHRGLLTGGGQRVDLRIARLEVEVRRRGDVVAGRAATADGDGDDHGDEEVDRERDDAGVDRELRVTEPEFGQRVLRAAEVRLARGRVRRVVEHDQPG